MTSAAAAARRPHPGRWATHVGGLPRPFWVLWSGALVNRMGSFVQTFFALYLTASLGKSVAEAGFYVSMFGAGGIGSQLVGGVLADRLGRRKTLTASMLSAAVALMALGFAHGRASLVLLSLLTGFTLDLYRPASSALIADLVPVQQRVRAFGLVFWAINLGWAVATLTGGLIAGASYHALFVADSLTCAAFAVIVRLGVPDTKAPAHHEPGALTDVLRDRTMMTLVGLTIASAMVYMQCTITLPIVMRSHGLSASAFGAIVAVNGIVIVLTQPFLVTRTARLPRVPVLVTAQVLMGGGFALTQLAGRSPSAYSLTVVVWTLGEVLQAGLIQATISDLAPAHVRGRYMGVFGFSFSVAATLAPVVGTQILGHGGSHVLWTWALVQMLAVGVALALLEPALERRGAAG